MFSCLYPEWKEALSVGAIQQRREGLAINQYTHVIIYDILILFQRKNERDK